MVEVRDGRTPKGRLEPGVNLGLRRRHLWQGTGGPGSNPPIQGNSIGEAKASKTKKSQTPKKSLS